MNQKNVSVAEQTKRELAAALKEAMAQKPLDKITISELTNACSIRRQSFYYHFEDIYDLLRWMFEKEAISLLRQQEGSLLWKEGLLQLFHYLEENRAVCLCALRSMGRDHMKRFLNRTSMPSSISPLNSLPTKSARAAIWIPLWMWKH